jgi:hypothetical protein
MYLDKHEKEEIQARILAANKAYSSLQSIFRSKQIHRNNRIKLYKTLINLLAPEFDI